MHLSLIHILKAQGCRKVLLHYGGQSAKKSGLLDRIEASLKEAGIDYISLGGVVPNPRLSLVYEGIRMCKAVSYTHLISIAAR